MRPLEAAGGYLVSGERPPSLSSRFFSYARALREPAISFLRTAAVIALAVGTLNMIGSPDYRFAMASMAAAGAGALVLSINPRIHSKI